MKRRTIALILALFILLLSGCKKTPAKEPVYVPYDYDLASYISLGKYIGVDYEELDTTVSDDEVDAEICRKIDEAGLYGSVFKGYLLTDLTEGEVIFGDSVNIDCTARLHGEIYGAACVSGLSLSVGSNSVGIYGFERALVGARIGGTTEFTLTLRNDFSDFSKRGEEVVFTVKINRVEKRRTLPKELTDEQKNAITQKPWDEYDESARASVHEQKEKLANEKKTADCFMAALKNSTLISYPQIETERYVSAYLDYLVNKSGETDIDAYAASHSTTVEALREQGMEYARGDVLQEMFIYAVARSEGFDKMSDELFDSFAIKYAQEYGLSSVKELTDAVGFYEVQKRVLTDVVKQYIADNGVPKASEADPESETEE